MNRLLHRFTRHARWRAFVERTEAYVYKHLSEWVTEAYDAYCVAAWEHDCAAKSLIGWLAGMADHAVRVERERVKKVG